MSNLNGRLNFDHGVTNVAFPNLAQPNSQAQMMIPKPGVVASYPVTLSSQMVGVNNHGSNL